MKNIIISENEDKEMKLFNNNDIYSTIKTSQKKFEILINKYESRENKKLLLRKETKQKKKNIKLR